MKMKKFTLFTLAMLLSVVVFALNPKAASFAVDQIQQLAGSVMGDNATGTPGKVFKSFKGEQGVAPDATAVTPRRAVTVDEDWYYYDNGINEDAIGTGGDTFYWGIMIPANSTTGTHVTAVKAYDYMAMTGKLYIYNDGDTAPASLVATKDIEFTGSDDFVTFTLTDVTIDPTKNVWVVFYNESGATYPAAMCADTGDANGRWISLDGETWEDILDYDFNYTFMIRAQFDGEAITPDPEPEAQYTFDDSTLQGWTTIDADGDGYTWELGSAPVSYLVEGADLTGTGHNNSADFVLSGSYSNRYSKALTPDNYLVSPKVALGGKITFYASALDATYAAEHFGVAVSTEGNTDAADFVMVSEEYVMTAAPAVNPAPASVGPKAFRSPRRVQGNWYKYEVDLSAFAGQEGYVAIRHYNCTDEFLLNVDDITIEEPEPEAQYPFDDDTMEPWTTIDADGDGYAWMHSSEFGLSGTGHNLSQGYMISQSFDNNYGALTPDNYLVSPKVVLGGKITFWAAAQDANWPSEHFGVAVSTKGNTDAADFVMVSEEYVMTAAPAVNPAPANVSPKAFRSSRRVVGNWYKYEVDLSAYAGQEGYVAIRHFNSTDNYFLNVDDITIVEGEELSYADIVVNPEDITDGNITKALDAKKAEVLEAQKSIRHITINLAEGEAYTVAAAIKAPANVTINGNGATIDASGADANFIELQGSSVKAIKADGETESDHYLIDAVTINEVTVNGLKKAIIRDTQKTLLKALTIENSVIEASDGKPALDFDGKGYIEQVTVNNSTVWSSIGTNKFFAKYGSRPKNLWSGDDAGPYTVQGFDVQNSTFVNIANTKNFCDISQKGTVNNVYTLKNNIFVNCGKSGQVVVGFNGGQTSATPVWDVDGNVFNYDGNDVSAAEVSKAGQKDDEDIVKNSLTCRVLFSDVEKPDFGGILVLAPGTEAPETLPGDPRWTIVFKQGYAINIDAKFGDVTTVPADYAAEGETVTITAKPNPADKFELVSVKVEGVNSDVEVVVAEDGTFTMPADAVIITATFQRIAEDIIVNPEDIEAGDIAAALDAKIASFDYKDPKTEEIIPVRIKDIFINLAPGESYTLTKTLTAPNNIVLSGASEAGDEPAVINVADGVTADVITLDGTETLAKKADGTVVADHKYITAVIISGVAIYDLKGAVVKDAQKTWLGSLTIYNSIIQMPDAGKNVIDFNSKGYVGHALVLNSTIYAEKKNTGFFAQYGSRPKNIDSDDTSLEQEFYVHNSTFANIANGKNFCDLKQKGTAQNVFTIKNSIFSNCGKSGQVVVGFDGGQASATPKWDVDGNVFNYDGNDVSAAEVSKAGQKDDEDIVKNSLTCRVLFSDVEKPDFGGILVLAPGTEAPETLPGDPRWLLSALDGYTITVQTSNGHGTASAQYPYAIEGEEVGLTIKPEEGYVIESIVMLDADGYVIGLVTGDTFTMPGQDVVIYVGFKKTATGIDAIENDADFEEGEWYTINGVRVDQPTKKGLYIHNGRKVVIK